MRRRWIVSIIGMAALFCLTACVGAGSHKPNASTDPQQPSASMNQAFAEVLENSLKKASLCSHASDAGRGVLYDLNGDGQEELIFYYQYTNSSIVFEAWSYQDGTPVQLSCVGDLPGIAGAGFPGVSLLNDDGKAYLAFWIENSESYPPGVKASYDVSLWEIQDKLLVSAQQHGIICHQIDSRIDQIFSAHGTFFDEETSIQAYSYFVNSIFKDPADLLLGGTLYGAPAGTPLAQLRDSLYQAP